MVLDRRCGLPHILDMFLIRSEGLPHKNELDFKIKRRIANPCTPVRFRYSPPFNFNDLHVCDASQMRASKHLSKHSVFVPFWFTGLLQAA